MCFDSYFAKDIRTSSCYTIHGGSANPYPQICGPKSNASLSIYIYIYCRPSPAPSATPLSISNRDFDKKREFDFILKTNPFIVGFCNPYISMITMAYPLHRNGPLVNTISYRNTY